MTVPEQVPGDAPTAPTAGPGSPLAVAEGMTAGEGGSPTDPVPAPGSGPGGMDAAPTAPPDPRGVDAADFRMTLVASVTLDLPNQHPTVVLREIETPRRQLTFAIGMSDAVALSHAQRRIPTPRPLTHELLSDVLRNFDIDVVAVRIVGRSGSLHFAELDLRGRSGRSVLSCRPSDALTVALHQPVQVPILVDARLLAGDGDVPPPGPRADLGR